MRIIIFIITQIAVINILNAQSLYCTTIQGGDKGGGTICKLENGKLTAAFSFDQPDGCRPRGRLLEASDGKLYGITSQGGSFNKGTIFTYNPVSGHYLKLKDFDSTSGSYPHGSLIQAKDGKLYGTTSSGGSEDQGVIFSYDIKRDRYTKLKDFDDSLSDPTGELVEAANGQLFGITSYTGYFESAIFCFNTATNTLTNVIYFNDSIGKRPARGLMKAKDGKLYGTAEWGGKYENGTIFCVDPVSKVFTKLYDFTDRIGRKHSGKLIQANNGLMYGLAYNDIQSEGVLLFSFNPRTRSCKKLLNFPASIGIFPRGPLMLANNGNLYGVAVTSAFGSGSLFSYNLSHNNVKIIKHLSGMGETFDGLMQARSGKLYGLAYGTLVQKLGAIYSLDIATSNLTTLRNFGINETGYSPRGGLVKDIKGILYGITRYGGIYGNGVIFSFDPRRSIYTKLKDIDSLGNYYSVPILTLARDGKLYIMKNVHWDLSSLFSFDLRKRLISKLFSLPDTTGELISPLFEGIDGKLYGAAAEAFESKRMTFFSYNPLNGVYNQTDSIINFNNSPENVNMLQASDGHIYGLVADEYGTSRPILFSLEPVSAKLKKLKEFNTRYSSYEKKDDGYPFCLLTQPVNGKLYGLMNEDPFSRDNFFFSYDLNKDIFSALAEMTIRDAIPDSRLTMAADGKFYGIWKAKYDPICIFPGEHYEPGGVYSYDPHADTFTRLQDFDTATGFYPADTHFIEAPGAQ